MYVMRSDSQPLADDGSGFILLVLLGMENVLSVPLLPDGAIVVGIVSGLSKLWDRTELPKDLHTDLLLGT